MLELNEMATLMQSNVIREFPDYAIDEAFMQGFDETDVRKGVQGFSGLLTRLFEVLKNCETPAKEALSWKGQTNIYTDLKSPLTLLYCMGLCADDSQHIDGSVLGDMYKKLHGANAGQYMRLLQDAGFAFSMDISAKSFQLAKAGTFAVTYPDDPSALIGLQVMAHAINRPIKAASLKDCIVCIFGRCDYNALASPKAFDFRIGEVANVLPVVQKQYLVDLHEHLMSNQCKYETKYGVNEYAFAYTSQATKAKVCTVLLSMETCFVKINTRLITTQPGLLDDAPEGIRDAVKGGYNCAKKNDPEACNSRCVDKNLVFELDGTQYVKCRIFNFALPIGETADRAYIMEWLVKEMAV